MLAGFQNKHERQPGSPEPAAEGREAEGRECRAQQNLFLKEAFTTYSVGGTRDSPLLRQWMER